MRCVKRTILGVNELRTRIDEMKKVARNGGKRVHSKRELQGSKRRGAKVLTPGVLMHELPPPRAKSASI